MLLQSDRQIVQSDRHIQRNMYLILKEASQAEVRLHDPARYPATCSNGCY